MCLDKILLDDSIEGDEDKPTVSPPVRTSSPPVLALPAPEVETTCKVFGACSDRIQPMSFEGHCSSLQVLWIRFQTPPAIFGKILAGQKSCVEKNSCMEQARKTCPNF